MQTVTMTIIFHKMCQIRVNFLFFFAVRKDVPIKISGFLSSLFPHINGTRYGKGLSFIALFPQQLFWDVSKNCI